MGFRKYQFGHKVYRLNTSDTGAPTVWVPTSALFLEEGLRSPGAMESAHGQRPATGSKQLHGAFIDPKDMIGGAFMSIQYGYIDPPNCSVKQGSSLLEAVHIITR